MQQPKMKKQKKDKQKHQKMQAFMSFLQAPTTTSQSFILQSQRKNNSDNQDVYEQYVEDTNQCYICHDKLQPTKKKKCAFCNLQTCNNHLRKRRKQNKKFQRICDECQDKHLFQNYMKLQLKAEQALITQQQIVTLKHQQYLSNAQVKRQKRRDIIFKTESLKQKRNNQMQKIRNQQAKLLSLQNKIESDQLNIKQLQIIIERLAKSQKQNFEQDFKILGLENDKLGKQLMRTQRRCQQIQKTIQKRQKQIEQAYEQWQKKQYVNKISNQGSLKQQKQKKDCIIY